MKRVALFLAFAVLMMANGVRAQSVSKPFSWTGFYIGADLGSITGTSDFTLAGGYATMHPSPNDFVGGVHAGYRWQTQSAFVFGLEADLWKTSASDAKKYECCTNEGVVDLKTGGSIRGIAGMSFAKTLVYATGGVSFIGIGGCTNYGPGTICATDASFGDTRSGWTFGGGVAYSFTPSLIARAEYLFADYGNKTYSTPGAGGGSTEIGLQTHTVRGGLSWKFN